MMSRYLKNIASNDNNLPCVKDKNGAIVSPQIVRREQFVTVFSRDIT